MAIEKKKHPTNCWFVGMVLVFGSMKLTQKQVDDLFIEAAKI